MNSRAGPRVLPLAETLDPPVEVLVGDVTLVDRFAAAHRERLQHVGDLAEDVVDDVQAHHLEVSQQPADHQRRSGVEAVEALLLRGAGEVPEVEADVLELQVRAHEDERLPVGEPLEELLPVGELDERLDVRRGEVAVEDLEQTERGLGLRGRHRGRSQEHLVVVDGIHARRGGDRLGRDRVEDALELDAAHPLRRLVQHVVELAVHAEHLVQLTGGGVQQAAVGAGGPVERTLFVGHARFSRRRARVTRGWPRPPARSAGDRRPRRCSRGARPNPFPESGAPPGNGRATPRARPAGGFAS